MSAQDEGQRAGDDFDVDEFVERVEARKQREKAERDAAYARGEFLPVKATPYRPEDPNEIPRIDYLYGKHCARGYVSALFGAGGSGKSSLEITRTLSMIVGRDLLHHNRRIRRPLRVWYIHLEDPRNAVQLAFIAAMEHFGISQEQVAHSLFLDVGREQRLVVLKRDEGGRGVKIVAPVINSIVAEAVARKIDLIIVDPFVSSHTVEENSNTEVQQVLDQWWHVADRAGVGVELVHHVNKASSAAGDVNAESGRGAGAFKDKTRSVEVLNVMDGNFAKILCIAPEDRFSFVRISLGKTNIAKMSGRADWFQLLPVKLSDDPDDTMAVAVPWKPPSPERGAGASDAHLLTIQGLLGRGRYHDHPGASNWAGRLVGEVLGLDYEDDADKIKRALKAWIKAGKLERVQRYDKAARKPRWFVEPPADFTDPSDSDATEADDDSGYDELSATCADV